MKTFDRLSKSAKEDINFIDELRVKNHIRSQ